MGIPQHVLEGNDEADKYFDDLELGGNGGNDPEKDDQGNDDDLDFLNGDDQQGSNDDQSNDQDFDDDPVPPKADDQGGDDSEWKQRAKVAEGRLQAQGRELSLLRQQLAQFQGSIAQAVQAELKRVEDERKRESEVMAARARLSESYGDDDIAAFEKIIESRTQRQNVPPAQEPPQDHGYNEQAVLHRYISAVSDTCGDPNAYLNNPEFKQWLYGNDPVSGSTRGALLSNADKSRDADTVITLFRQFDREKKGRSQAAMERNISPGRSRAGSTRPTSQQQFLSQEQISAAHDQINAAMMRGDWAKVKRLQDRIAASEAHYGI